MRKNLVKTIITITYILLSIFITSYFLVISDNNMNSKQGLPDFTSTTLDFTGYDIEGKYVKQHMKGNYEFYYNKFIVSDNIDCAYDAIVSVPHHFKQTKINGESLSTSAYASYKCYVKGLPIGTKIWFINNNFVGSYQVFINKELVLRYGTLDKDKDSKSNGGDDYTSEYTVSNTDTLEIVIEVARSTQGGLTTPCRLVINTLGRNPTIQYLTNNIGFIIFGIILGLLIFSFVININITTRDLKFTLFMIVITLISFFSIDVYWRFLSFAKLNIYNSIITINLILSLLLSYLLYNLLSSRNYISNKKYVYYIFSINSIIDITLYIILRGTYYQVIPLMMSLINYIIITVLLVNNLKKDKHIISLFILMTYILILYYNLTFFDLENIMLSGLERTISYFIIPLIIIVIILYRTSVVRQTKKYINLLETEKQSLILKSEALKHQIKPHYIFNLLTSIKEAYREDQTRGEEMLERFSLELRNNLNTKYDGLIPLENEINTILNYIKLEELRLNKPINFLLDIEVDNILVPSISLEVFVENAVKHSCVLDKEDGYISLSTYTDCSYNIIEIEDNGIGFDVNNNINKRVGINNTIERFKISLNADVIITSYKNIGTKIKIMIPKEESNENNSPR